MEEIEEINISWEGPFRIEEILNGSIEKQQFRVKSNDIGLYQIYGFHPIYGDNVLVYIGRTKDRKGFKSRLKKRWVIEHGCDTEHTQIYLGTIYSDSIKYDHDVIENKIEKAEVLLINALTPAYNSSNIQSVKKDIFESRYIVYNYGNYRKIFPVLDSKYFWHDHKNRIYADKIKKIFKQLKFEETEEYYGAELNDDNIFNIPKEYKIWFGIDNEVWDRENVPLVLEVYSDNQAIMEKIKKTDGLKYFKYEVEDSQFFYKSLDVELSTNEAEFKSSFQKQIEELVNCIKL